mmetsp:Transcript_26706/g.48103  ORF Transcript_26706/g.48103 Transcript_26706/m.48103 type:complete len:124 (-) Transcript_26706:1081-1452(-)
MEETPEQPLTPAEDEKYKRVLMQIRTLFAITHIKNDKEPTHILNGLYLGSIGPAMSRDVLVRHGITHVLTVADSIKPSFPDIISYKVLPILDSPSASIAALIDEAYEFIETNLEAGGKVLVHW